MFLKPFRVKTQTAIKGSDRKKLRAELGKQFTSLSVDDLSLLVPQKDEMSAMKIFTHAGQTLTVFNICKNPAFFEVDKCLYPTVYTLWTFPDLLPVFTTWPPVFKKISGGADLMLPGVITKGDVTPQSLGNYEKGTPCAIKLLGNKCPVAVGNTSLSSFDMYMSAMRGKGVNVLHSYQDYLWAHGDKTLLPTIEDPEMLSVVQKSGDGEGEDDEDKEDAEAEDANKGDADDCAQDSILEDVDVSAINLEDAGDHDSQGANDDGPVTAAELAGDEDADAASKNPTSSDPQGEMDDLFLQCFMCALKMKLKQNELPLLTSKFFKTHMQPCCPSAKALDVKKSSYKKLSKFLQAMRSKGYIEIKEFPKGVENIVNFDKNHSDIREFEVTLSPEPAAVNEERTQREVGFQPPNIIEVLVVTANVLPLFAHKGYSKGSVITAPEARNIVIDYIKENDLQDKEAGMVIVDPHLGDLVLSKGDCSDRMKYETVIARCVAKLTPAHQITRPGFEPVIRKGKLEPITFNVVSRAGNKKVTLIDNLEVYGIDLDEFSHLVQKGVASSATVQQSSKGPQVLVQGNQINYIAQLLTEKYHIQKKWLHGLDKAPKPGKKKR